MVAKAGVRAGYLILLLLVTHCSLFCPMNPRRIDFPELPAEAPGAHGTVLVLGGLNTKVEVLNQISNVVAKKGWRVRPVLLAANSSNDVRPVSREIWLAGLEQAYQQAQRDYPNEPVALLGYSLGAVLALDFKLNVEKGVSDLFLIAPPVQLRWLNALALWFGTRIPFDLSIPSAAEPAYRARSYTPISHYEGLRQVIRSVRGSSSRNAFQGSHLTVIASTQDEFISLSSITEWIAENAPQANLIVIDKSSGTELGMAHQIIDQHSVAAPQWDRIQQAIEEHYNLIKQGEDSNVNF